MLPSLPSVIYQPVFVNERGTRKKKNTAKERSTQVIHWKQCSAQSISKGRLAWGGVDLPPFPCCFQYACKAFPFQVCSLLQSIDHLVVAEERFDGQNLNNSCSLQHKFGAKSYGNIQHLNSSLLYLYTMQSMLWGRFVVHSCPGPDSSSALFGRTLSAFHAAFVQSTAVVSGSSADLTQTQPHPLLNIPPQRDLYG